MDLKRSLTNVFISYIAIVIIFFYVAHDAIREICSDNIYQMVVTGVGIVLLSYLLILNHKSKHNKRSIVLNWIKKCKRYRFLFEQLVIRDFKVKYKRSVMGVLWSLLNPLLTVGVQYVVFKNIFRINTQNYIVYLIVGVVFFNFFQEGTNLSMTAILENVSLITKVSVPKKLYIIAKMASALINLALSLIPLFIVMVLTNTAVTVQVILLGYGIICLAIFTFGVSLVLASLLVFFRDIKFLWGVLAMIWMYLTPVIYPVSILGDKVLMIIKINPLYHFIDFSRTILLYGESPDLIEYAICLGYAILALLIGTVVFNKTEDKFILNI